MNRRLKFRYNRFIAGTILACSWLVSNAQAELGRPHHPGYGYGPMTGPYGYPYFRPQGAYAIPNSSRQNSPAQKQSRETASEDRSAGQDDLVTATVTISEMRFDPPWVTIKPGGTVTWKQVGEIPHAIITNDGSLSSPLLAGNSEFSHTFEEPGSYSYHCIIHPSMQGDIRVMK